jgi:hypothetical protein
VAAASVALKFTFATGCTTVPSAASNAGGKPAIPVPQTPTLLEARREKSHPAISYLTYQHIDKLFSVFRVRVAERADALGAGRTWDARSFRFWHKEQEISFDQFLERNRTNAAIVLQDGKVVTQIYRNGSGPSTQFIG